MTDQFILILNILMAVQVVFTFFIFWFSWRKRPDLRDWFISIIIYAISHVLFIFKQVNPNIAYVGNGLIVIALLVVIASTFKEYYLSVFKPITDEHHSKNEKKFLVLIFSVSLLFCILIIILLQLFLFLTILVVIALLMITLLVPILFLVMKIYRKQRTITRLFMFYTFIIGAVTATTTILTVYAWWGHPLNYAFNFVFITLMLTTALAAPVESRLASSEEKYRILSVHLEDEVSERTLQLKEALEELESFSYSVSHDLKSPLRSIQGFSKALSQDFSSNLDAEGKDFLERIIKSSDRMDHLITDLLKLSNTLRYTDYNIESIDLSNLADDILKDLLLLYPDYKVVYHIQEDMSINSDPKLIRIILENLFGNALKFSTANSNPKIEFGTLDQDNTTVFFVRDNGVGFDMKYIDKLFGVFQRLHTIEEFEGSGIGLATVKRIIQKLDGKIWAEGEINQGAIFYFTINQK